MFSDTRSSNVAFSNGRQALICTWPMYGFHGWGVYGFNLALQWADDPDLLPLFPFGRANIDDQLTLEERKKLAVIIDASKDLEKKFLDNPKAAFRSDFPCFKALGAQLSDGQEEAGKFGLRGHPELGVVFLENTNLDSAARERGKTYSLLVAGSGWNRDLLESCKLGPVKTVFQGVDTNIFFPAPTQVREGKEFRIFSGGKLEYRKGQDLVLLAFQRFAQRHADAQLITAWQSPWPHLGRTLETNPEIAALRFKDDRTLNVGAWAEANDIAGDRVVDVGLLPNRAMADMMRRVDVAIFPNRAEGGTNLVAMECMASGIPVILSENTGHLDLLEPGCTLGLKTQGPVAFRGVGTDGWGESSVDEMVEALERVYQDRNAAFDMGQRACQMMQDWSWKEQSATLKQTIMPYL